VSHDTNAARCLTSPTAAAIAKEPARSSRLVSIDLLRGIAVLLVLVAHLPFSNALLSSRDGHTNISIFPDWVLTFTGFGRVGVHLFLVISGFCIHMTWARRSDHSRPVSFLAFWRRRLHRLYPPYLVALALTLVGLALFARVAHAGGWLGYASPRQLVIDLILLVLLLQNFNGAALRVGNAPFWTLALEEQLYMLYFPLLRLRRRWGWTRALACVAVVTFGWRALAALTATGALPPAPVELFALGPSRWLEWALGALAVEAWLGVVTLPSWCSSPPLGFALLAGAFVLNLPSMPGHAPLLIPIVSDAAFGIAFFVLLNAACRREQHLTATWMRALAGVGVWSYSLYLTHEPLMVAAKWLGQSLHADVPAILALRIVVPLVGAWTFHRLVERRFMNRPAAG
jgi:peptidoglycan/LPS O-acetylase OafA/YrhL